MRKSGLAIMGTGIAGGENRAEDAVEKALNSPLLNNNDIRGARNILLNITSGTREATIDEVGRITDFVQNRAGFNADLIWGNGKEESLGDEISVTVIATGFSRSSISGNYDITETTKEKLELKEVDIETKRQVFSKSSVKKEIFSPGQKTIEFDIEREREKEDDDFEALYPGTKRERSNSAVKDFNGDYSSINDEDVESLENIPAYQRRNIRINDPKYKKQVSGLTVTRDNKISDKNSYLHGQVD
jgi:cell division protein FtsZ